MLMQQEHGQRQEPSIVAYYLEALRDLLLKRDFEFTEFQVWFATFAWGLWLLNPFWNTFETSPSFRIMSYLAPEWVWGIFGIFIAVSHTIGLYVSHEIRKQAVFCEFLFWLFVAFILVLANYKATGAVIYPILTLSSAWVYLRMVAMKKG